MSSSAHYCAKAKHLIWKGKPVKSISNVDSIIDFSKMSTAKLWWLNHKPIPKNSSPIGDENKRKRRMFDDDFFVGMELVTEDNTPVRIVALEKIPFSCKVIVQYKNDAIRHLPNSTKLYKLLSN